jgi:hypothetical protein
MRWWGRFFAVAIVCLIGGCTSDALSSRTHRPTASPGVDAEASALAWSDGGQLAFSDVPSAVRFLDRYMDVPIQVPRQLLAGDITDVIVYMATIRGERSAQLQVFVDIGRPLMLQFGLARLDGCAPENSVSVRIGGEPGRLRVSEQTAGTWSELIWPATLGHPLGTYGLAGWLSKREVLAMARSMEPGPIPPGIDLAC